jgi:prepilin-type N-terminal cleavage/methylation domain-containing protein
MNRPRTTCSEPVQGFTLIELLVTIAIIAILSSLSLAGLAVARQSVKADRTETTIRKIHEALMPHYEQFASRRLPAPNFSLSGQPTLTSIVNKGISLVAKRRMMTLELPDGWRDLLQATDHNSAVPQWTPTTYQSGISRHFSQVCQAFTPAQITSFGQTYGDSECLWMSVMQAGYADPGIIGHFREDEFGDKDDDGQREFIDGWGRPIRFLRWAPGFVSKYQPAASAGTQAHDAFDLANVDPYAQATLFPLIYSMGPDGQSDIANRDQPALAQFSYPEVGYDPNFAMRLNNDPNNNDPNNRPKDQSQRCHLTFSQRSPAITVRLGSYVIPSLNSEPLGKLLSSQPDDVHNHSMSR